MGPVPADLTLPSLYQKPLCPVGLDPQSRCSRLIPRLVERTWWRVVDLLARQPIEGGQPLQGTDLAWKSFVNAAAPNAVIPNRDPHPQLQSYVRGLLSGRLHGLLEGGDDRFCQGDPVREVMERGANPNAVDLWTGQFPIQLAMSANSDFSGYNVGSLLAYRANPRILNQLGETGEDYVYRTMGYCKACEALEPYRNPSGRWARQKGYRLKEKIYDPSLTARILSATFSSDLLSGQDLFRQCGSDVLKGVFSYLSMQDLISLTSVSKYCYHVASEDCLWLPIAQKYASNAMSREPGQKILLEAYVRGHASGQLIGRVSWDDREGGLPTLEELLTYGVDPNGVDPLDPLLRPPLHKCLLEDHEILEVLLAYGADANAQDVNGRTPLHVLLETSSDDCDDFFGYETLRKLVAHGADSSIPDNGGNTPLLLGLGSTEDDYKLIARCAADIDAKDSEGFTALHRSVSRNPDYFTDFSTRLLIKNGANPNVQNRQGQTSLHLAAMHANYEMYVMDLIQAGAEPSICDNEGRRAVDLLPEGACEDSQDLLGGRRKLKGSHRVDDSLTADAVQHDNKRARHGEGE